MGYLWLTLAVVAIAAPTIVLMDECLAWSQGLYPARDLARAWLRVSVKTGAAGAVMIFLYQMSFG